MRALAPAALGATLLLGLAAGAPRPAARLRPSDLRFDGAAAFREVSEFVAAGGGPRPAGSPAHAAALAHLRGRLAALGLPGLEEKRFDSLVDASSFILRRPAWKEHLGRGGEIPITNLLVEFPGASDEVVLVACHHDSVPNAPGADDNASSVGVALGLARALQGRALGRAVRIAFFDGEELGLVGSRAYAAGLAPEARTKIVAAIATEMLGWSDGTPTLHFFRASFYRDTPIPPGDLVQRVAAASARGGARLAVGDPWLSVLYQAVIRHCRPPLGSDEGAFAEIGVPGVLLAGSSFASFYPHYHQATDTVDRLSAETLGRSGRALEAAVLELAAAPRIVPDRSDFLMLRTRRLSEGWLRAVSIVAGLGLAYAGRRARGRSNGATPALVGGALLVVAAAFAFDLLLPVAVVPAALAATLALEAGSRTRIALRVVACLPAAAFLALLVGLWSRFGGFAQFDSPVLPTAAATAALVATLQAAFAGPRTPKRA